MNVLTNSEGALSSIQLIYLASQLASWHCPCTQQIGLQFTRNLSKSFQNATYLMYLKVCKLTFHMSHSPHVTFIPFGQKIHITLCLFPKLTLSSQSCSLNPASVSLLILLHILAAVTQTWWYIKLKRDQLINIVCGTRSQWCFDAYTALSNSHPQLINSQAAPLLLLLFGSSLAPSWFLPSDDKQ